MYIHIYTRACIRIHASIHIHRPKFLEIPDFQICTTYVSRFQVSRFIRPKLPDRQTDRDMGIAIAMDEDTHIGLEFCVSVCVCVCVSVSSRPESPVPLS